MVLHLLVRFWDKSFSGESEMILIRGSGLGYPLGIFFQKSFLK